MARVIERAKPQPKKPQHSIAIREHVNTDELKKKYVEDVKNGKINIEPFDIEKEKVHQDMKAAADLIDFFDLGDEIQVDPTDENPGEMIEQITSNVQEGSKETLDLAETHREKTVEEDKAEAIEQLSAFAANKDDPLLNKDFKEKSESIIKKFELEKNKEPELVEFARIKEEEERKSESGYSGYKSGYNTNSYSTSSFKSSYDEDYKPSSSSSQTKPKQGAATDEERAKKYQWMVGNAAQKTREYALSGPKKTKPKKKTRAYGSGKWSFKGMVSSVKRWFRSEDASTLMKFGSLLCLELGLAVITKKYEFDNTGQLLSFLAMMMGVFYISREVAGDGFDPRRMSLL